MRIVRQASVAVAALLAAQVGTGCGRRTEAPPATPQVQVTAANVVRAETRRLEEGISFTGELTPAEIVEIVARFDGDLEAVLVREGETVQRGQALARYKPREMRDAYDSAEAALQAAQADLEVADNAVRRAQRLVNAGAAAPTELENATAARKAAEARLRGAQASLNQAQENAEKLTVPSPLRGTVSQVIVHSGSRTAVGDKLMTLVDTSTMELSATIPSEALASIRVGTPVEFRVDAFPGETFTGRIDRINPTTEPGTRQVRVYMRLPNPDHKLVGGLFASGRLIRDVDENAIAAPVAALRQEGGEQVVYRVRNGLAERLAIVVGIVDEAAGVVGLQGGLAPGDSLLTGVLPGLRPGARVRILSGTAVGNGGAKPTADGGGASAPPGGPSASDAPSAGSAAAASGR